MNSIINVLLFVVFAMILAAFFVGVSIYFKKISLEDLQAYFNVESQSVESKSLDSPNAASKWTNIFAAKEVPHFSYPSPELVINLDFSHAKKTNILKIKNLDSYKFFCLNEILKSNNIQFAYKKVADFVTLEVAIKEDKMKQNLINELKRYNISYSID